MPMDEDGKVFVSDVIGDAYKDWKPGDLIGISAGTGTGKTEFALRIMAKEVQKQGKNILFLSNRNPLKEQTQKKVEKTRLDYSLITVMNYQALQSMIDQHMDLEHYDYIFADECHYLLSDAMMNSATDLSFDFLINNPDSVVILMSATGNKLFYWLTEIKRIKPENIYHLEQDYSHVDKVVLYDADAFFPLVNNLLDSDPDSKILVILYQKVFALFQ